MNQLTVAGLHGVRQLFEVDEIILFYPNTIKQGQEEETELTIKDALADGKEISIRAFQLPIINRELFETDLVTKTDLGELFESTRLDLIHKIEKILVPAHQEYDG